MNKKYTLLLILWPYQKVFEVKKENDVTKSQAEHDLKSTCL